MPDEAKTEEDNELTEFIAQSLRAINDGIKKSGISQAFGPVGAEAFRMPKDVKFDIAVTAKQSKEAGGGLKLQVFGAGVDVGGKGADEAQTVSRIEFTIPWQYEGVLDRAIGPKKSTVEIDSDV
ncbi:trypco2 family protein [Pontixanthobacter sp.]|uniref:trypco2 family protein n=1 Tax=Pontixanthobacter sp. TaxID=2792078 RepID=UPI003C7B4518